MEEWFKKYPYKETERDAVKMIHDCLERAKKAYREDRECYTDLATAHSMLEDFFSAKGMNPKAYVK